MKRYGSIECLAATIVLAIAGSMWGHAQQAPLPQKPAKHTVGEKRRWKAENGLLISWSVRSKDETQSQVEVFDESGNSLTKVQVLKFVQEATSSAIYDVSAHRDQMIVVAAVFARRPGERPAAALLLFDFNGRLRSAFALAPSREIFRLELDDKSNIWTIGTGSGDQAPLQVPMVVEYDTRGNVLRELLNRSMFPQHAEIMEQNAAIGPVSSGYDSGVFWFWLPGSTELVTLKADNSNVSITKTGLPSRSAVPLWIVRDGSGNLVGEFRDYHSDLTVQNAYNVWSPSVKSWSPFKPTGCELDRLVGVDQDRLVHVHSGGPNICTSAAP